MKKQKYFSLLSFVLLLGVQTNAFAEGKQVIKTIGTSVERVSTLAGADMRSMLTRMASYSPVGGKVMYELNYNIGGVGKADILKVLPDGKGVYVNIGDSKEVFIPGALVDYIPYLYQLSSGASLSKVSFPALWQKNEDMLAQSLDYSMRLLMTVKNNEAAFHGSLRSHVKDGTAAYYDHLPATGVDYIYVGEVHLNPLIQEELLQLLQEIKSRYSKRHVYLATEYMWDAYHPSTLKDDLPLALANDKKDLLNIMGKEAYVNNFFLHKVLELGIPVVGLEPRFGMANEASVHSGITDPARLYRKTQQLSLSEVGLGARNDRWVDHIEKIREQDPKALVVIHGGAQHTSLQNLFSVSNKLKGKFFSIMLLDQRGKDITTPTLALLKDQTFLDREFVQAKEGKYLLYFKKPNLSVGRTPELLDDFRRAVGADLVVVLDDLSPMIDP